jgi:hypothetical protein
VEPGDQPSGLVERADLRFGVGELGFVVSEDLVDDLVGERAGGSK